MNTSKPTNYNEELHILASAEAAKVQDRVREFLSETEKDPDELEALELEMELVRDAMTEDEVKH